MDSYLQHTPTRAHTYTLKGTHLTHIPTSVHTIYLSLSIYLSLVLSYSLSPCLFTVSQIVNRQGQLMKELKARENTHVDLARRVMRIYRKQGLREYDSVRDQELRRRITVIERELTDPSRCIGRLQDMIAKVDMQDHDDDFGEGQLDVASGFEMPTPSEATIHKLMEHLRVQQRGINHLVEVIKQDLAVLDIINQRQRTVENRGYA